MNNYEPNSPSARWQKMLVRMRRWLESLLSKWRRENTSSDPHSDGVEGGSRIFSIGAHQVVFGMTWVPAQSDQIRAVHEQARKSGMRSHVTLGTLIGFASTVARPAGRVSAISGALVLSESASMGGSEIFVLDIEPGVFALVALQDSMPVPGFDLVGDLPTIKAAVDNYIRLPHRTTVRRCGSRDVIEDAEFFNFEYVLEESDHTSIRLKEIRDNAKLIRWLAIVLILFGLAVGVYLYVSHLNRMAEQARLMRENDPDVLYEKAFSLEQSKLGPMGKAGFQAMFETARHLPLVLKGWVLSQVKCTHQECKATWIRRHGSYADFESVRPADVQVRPEYKFPGKTEATPQLETSHPVAINPAAQTLVQLRDTLPMKSLVEMEFISQLQDYSLVKLNGTVSAPSLFGGKGDATLIFRPVLSGEWSASGDLWQLEGFHVPDYALVEVLQVTNMEQIEKNKLPTYFMSGKYFVKGKDFK